MQPLVIFRLKSSKPLPLCSHWPSFGWRQINPSPPPPPPRVKDQHGSVLRSRSIFCRHRLQSSWLLIFLLALTLTLGTTYFSNFCLKSFITGCTMSQVETSAQAPRTKILATAFQQCLAVMITPIRHGGHYDTFRPWSPCPKLTFRHYMTPPTPLFHKNRWTVIHTSVQYDTSPLGTLSHM